MRGKLRIVVRFADDSTMMVSWEQELRKIMNERNNTGQECGIRFNGKTIKVTKGRRSEHLFDNEGLDQV